MRIFECDHRPRRNILIWWYSNCAEKSFKWSLQIVWSIQKTNNLICRFVFVYTEEMNVLHTAEYYLSCKSNIWSGYSIYIYILIIILSNKIGQYRHNRTSPLTIWQQTTLYYVEHERIKFTWNCLLWIIRPAPYMMNSLPH